MVAKLIGGTGYDIQSTPNLLAYINKWERYPLDGIAFNIDYNSGGAKTVASNVFVDTALVWSDLEPALERYKQIKFKRFLDNFVRVNVDPGTVDVFDDYSNVINNITLVARWAKQAGCKGIWWDAEDYTGNPYWKYSTSKYQATKSSAEYHVKTRERGAAFMSAIKAEFPDIVFLSSFNYSGVAAGATNYELYQYFLDGMFSVVDSRTIMVDGVESAYGYYTPREFRNAYGYVYIDWRDSYCASDVKANYNATTSAGFGLFLDQNDTWDDVDYSANYFTPERWEDAIAYSLAYADHYVWIYNHTPMFFSMYASHAIPHDYITATLRGKRRAALHSKTLL